MKTNLNDLMNIVQMVKPERRHRTRVKFTGNFYVVTSSRDKDYFDLDSYIIKSTKIIYGDERDTIEIELG
tara:strand:+ start:236 stop:445 length:210 start_codon:yes stop_codon:yes gene_type:complete